MARAALEFGFRVGLTKRVELEDRRAVRTAVFLVDLAEEIRLQRRFARFAKKRRGQGLPAERE